MAGVIRDYTPLAPKRLWNEDVQKFTRDAVTAIAPVSENEASMYMRAIAGLAIWSVHIACQPLEQDVVFNGAHIDSYIRRGGLRMAPAQLRNLRLRLLRAASELSVYDPDRRDFGKSVASKGWEPYTPKEIIRIRSLGASRSTARRRHNWMTIVSLATGCALKTTEIIDLPVDAIRADADGVHVTVRGKRPRTVTCLASWEDDVKALIESPLVGDYVLIHAERPTNPALYIRQFQRAAARPEEHFQVERLRSTWIATHLQARTPVLPLMHALGAKSLSTIERLEQFIPVPDDAAIAAYFRLAR